ncbi:MAG: DNA repair protein RadC [Cyanobacteriota bacterium]|nr:DNA repair protein RadC [Cyanobacteriota bacterium]
MSLYSLRMADIPVGERPRERLLAEGSRSLATAELLAILLGTGQGAGKLSAVGLGQLLLRELGQHAADPLSRLREVGGGELMQIAGVGPAKATTILAAVELGRRIFLARPNERTVIDSPQVAASVLSGEMMWDAQEHFGVVLLDIKNRLIGQQIVTKGTATETLSHPRETFKTAVRLGASRILVAHNHPSGSLDPSPEDLALTRQLLQSGQILGIPLLDHLILGGGQFLSLREQSRLWQDYPQEEGG